MYLGVCEGLGASFVLSHAGIFCGFVCVGVCLSEYDTPKTAIFSDLNYFFCRLFIQLKLESLGLYGVRIRV